MCEKNGSKDGWKSNLVYCKTPKFCSHINFSVPTYLSLTLDLFCGIYQLMRVLDWTPQVPRLYPTGTFYCWFFLLSPGKASDANIAHCGQFVKSSIDILHKSIHICVFRWVYFQYITQLENRWYLKFKIEKVGITRSFISINCLTNPV